MITEWLVNVGVAISGFIAALFPELLLPPFVADVMPGLYDFLESASGLGNWFAWGVLGVVVGVLAAWFLGVFAIKLLLKIWSLVPFGGGGS